jgi:tetratricopeptide (TPR) repeat protein
MSYRALALSTVFLFAACGGAATGDGGSTPRGPATLEQGELLLERGEHQEAAAVFGRILEDDPANAQAHYYLGVCKRNLGDLEGAEQQYRLAIGYDANLPAAHNNLGLLLLEKGDLTHAESELHTYLGQKPEDAGAHYNYALVLEESGDLSGAEEHYEKAASLDPEDPAPWAGLGDLSRRGGKLEEALERYREGRRTASDSAELAIREGQTLLDLKRLDEAIAVFEGLDGMEDCGPDLLATAGVLLARFDENDRAISLYRAAIARSDDYAPAHLMLANALARKKEFGAAAGHYERFLALAPDAPEAETAKQRLEICRSQAK